MKLKSYPEYKDSGVEWLRQVPDGWTVTKIKHVTSFTTGWTPPTGDSESFEGNNLWANISDLGPKILNDTSKRVSDEAIKRSKTSVSPKGSLLFSFKLSIGQVGIAGRDLYTNEAIATFLPDNEARLDYLYYASPVYIVENTSFNIYGAKLLNQELINAAVIALPNQEGQRQIAAFLDRETGKLDTLISKQEQLIDRFNERIIATVMGALLSTETQYIRLAHVCEVISRPVNQSSENAFTRLGVLNRGRGLFKREETDSEDMGDSDFFWVKNGDLVLSGQFAWEGSVAMANEEHEDCVVSHRFPIIKGKPGVVLTEYLLALFMTSHGDFLLNENSRGSAGRNRPLNMSLLLKEKIPIASMAVQNEVSNLLRLQKKLKDKALIQIDLLKEHRTALISAAVTGKIDVREAA